MANFGTYEGHRILSNAMNNTVNNAIKVKEAKEKRKLVQQRINNQEDQFNKNYSLAVEADNRNKQIFERDDLQRKIGNDLLTQMRPESYQFINDAGELGDPDSIKETLTGPLSKAYIENIMQMDPNNQLSIGDKEALAAQVSKSHATRVYDEMVGQMREAGWDEDEIDRQIENAGLTDAMDDFLLRGMGRKPDDDFYSTGLPDTDLDKLEKTASTGNVSSYRHSDKKTAKNKQKLLINAMDKFKQYTELDTHSGMWDDIDDLNVNQKPDGSWELIESDMFNDSNFDIKWDKDRPYITSTYLRNKIYLDEASTYDKLWNTLE